MKSIDPNIIKAFHSLSDKTQLDLVLDNFEILKYVKSEKVKLEAVKNYGIAIKFIKNPSEQMKLEAVKQNGNAIYYIKNPSEQVQLEAVKRNGNAIYYIKNPSKKVKELHKKFLQ